MKKLIGSAKRKREDIFDETFSLWTEEDDTNISLDDLPEDLKLKGKDIEKWIIKQSFNSQSVDKLEKISYTAPHDIENEIDEFQIQTIFGEKINRNISIKTTTTNTIDCADAVIFINEYIKLIEEGKKFDMIIIKLKKFNNQENIIARYLRINLNNAHNNDLTRGVSKTFDFDDLRSYLDELINIKKFIKEMNVTKDSSKDCQIIFLVNALKKKYNFLYFTLSFKKQNYDKNRPARLQIIFKLGKFLKSLDKTQKIQVIRDSGRYFTIVTNFKKPKVDKCGETDITPETLNYN